MRVMSELHSLHTAFSCRLGASPCMQARKAVAAALSTGRISEDWLQGKTLVFHSPTASNIEVRCEPCKLQLWFRLVVCFTVV